MPRIRGRETAVEPGRLRILQMDGVVLTQTVRVTTVVVLFHNRYLTSCHGLEPFLETALGYLHTAVTLNDNTQSIAMEF